MPDIQIHREHTLGLAEARKLAFRWAELAEQKFDMACSYEEGKTSDLVSFTRSGVNGELKVTAERFDISLPTKSFEDNFDERFLGLDTYANQPPLIAISVLDQGPGIPRDVLPRVFEPYYTTKTHTGTGLGLAIVSRLVKAHHGLVHIKTKAGEGTRFTIYLPGRTATGAQAPF